MAAALVIGLLLGLLGGGGSILTLPVLIYLAGQQPQSAIAASLFVVTATSAVALIPHARARRVQWRTGLVFGTAGLAGAYVGGRLSAYLSSTLLLAGFGLLVLAAATTMVRSCRRPRRDTRSTVPLPVLPVLGGALGMFTGMVGAGGGFVIVPLLVLLAGLSMATAVGTSLLVITLQAGAGFVGHLHHVHIDWAVTLTITTLAIVGSLAGARLADRVPASVLRASFGWFLGAMGTLIVLEQAPASIRHAIAGTASGRILLTAAFAALALAAARHIRDCRARPVEPRSAAVAQR